MKLKLLRPAMRLTEINREMRTLAIRLADGENLGAEQRRELRRNYQTLAHERRKLGWLQHKAED